MFIKESTSLAQIANNQRITIVIGSGVNKYSLGDKNSILTCWEKLLDSAFGIKFKSDSKNYILDFERRLVAATSKQDEKNADKTQGDVLSKICQSIGDEQVNKKYSANYPLFLFDNRIVANVISLNFDLIPEIRISGGKIPKLGKRHVSMSAFGDSNVSRYREIDGIRFWHPHGDVQNKNSLVLGMRQYIKNLGNLELMRTKQKSSKRNDQNATAFSWYEALVHFPVIVIGAGLSDNELDIWGALINRERNFAKKTNRIEYRKPIYMMWSKCESGEFKKPDWVKPLFDINNHYDEQWKKLKQLFDKK
jgi:hypothetical protein